MEALKRNPKFQGRRGPVVLTIMDGVGIGKYKEGDAVLDSPTPFLHHLMETMPCTQLKAHGTAVGLPSDADMGNSEVGHNAMGAGRVFAQGAKLVSSAISTGKMFQGEVWKKVMETGKTGTVHFLGLFSDGNVHSHIDHLKGMLEVVGDYLVGLGHESLDGRDKITAAQQGGVGGDEGPMEVGRRDNEIDIFALAEDLVDVFANNQLLRVELGLAQVETVDAAGGKAFAYLGFTHPPADLLFFLFEEDFGDRCGP